jgi:hypothetical protein
MGDRVVAHGVSRVNSVAGYPVYVVQNITRAAFQGPVALPAAAPAIFLLADVAPVNF